jgi:hypothetical protein
VYAIGIAAFGAAFLLSFQIGREASRGRDKRHAHRLEWLHARLNGPTF